ncbi:hypothetical protein [Cryobacterium psychrophilum]|uniref:Uncharacterized protein n=1 Tax=Cryobacterium psychrophilum TaxID=41988 RepID=A0A4Y8KLJ6_9MICO|nr:hypothetical protein [Cryobacterium psychrophilum]TDW29964.1 hypothetical protein EDD25_1690 [Cryobacterium psychrophilum]TFD76523.1 hypothetical protein E3T53_13685 [Cryobacterium psychrophilum]
MSAAPVTFATRPIEQAGRAALSSRIIVAVVLILLGMRVDLPQGLTVGYLAVIALAPVWLRVLPLYRGAVTIFITGLVCLISGVWLNGLAAPTHVISLGETANVLIGLVGILISIGFVLWAREVMSPSWLALWFGVGLCAGVTSSSGMYAENPWKFGYSFAVTVVALALAHLSGRRWLEFAVIGVLTVVSMFTDSRSSFAILFITAILVVWQMLPTWHWRAGRRRSGGGIIVGMAALATLVFYLAQKAILAGSFGEATRERTVAQLNAAGSLILGGRPELAATLSLMRDRPLGFGAGTLLNPEDLQVAKTGMASINYAPNNGYVEKYMFGGHIELHSVFGDLWAHFGIPGLALTAILLGVVVWGLASSSSVGAASGVMLFLGVNALWALLFGPLYSATRLIIIVVALSLVRRGAVPVTPERPPGRFAQAFPGD